MDEESLTAAINEYKEQFLQVQNVLQATGEEGQEDMVKIRDDLVELIHLSEERLLTLKKNRLLQALEEQEASGSSTLSFDEDGNDKNVDSTTENPESVEEEDIIGTKCRVAYTQEWGVKQHHNAMVFSVEMSDDESPDDAKVRVLFLNPTHKSMVPCPYFLDGKCRFSENECRYSHGFLVDEEDLKPFKEPNFSEIEEGQQCLARYTDGVWYKSTIKSVDEDHHEFVVHYDTYNTDVTLGLDSIFPLDKEESPELSNDDLSSLSSDSEESRLTNGDQDDNDDDEQASKEWKPTGTSLGDWEQHTRGIGSKLMARMGYIFGKGLGKDGSGRVDPVEVVVLPQGKSLDVCAELREKKKLKEPFKKKRKKKNSSTKALNIPKQGTINDVFLFLNHKFGGNRGNIQEIKKSTASEQFDIKDRKRRKGTEDDANVNWNVKLFKIHEEITAAEKQLHRQRQAHGRHATTDTNTSSFFKKKVEGLEHHITQLKTKEKMIKQKIHQKDQHRKLTVF